MKHLNGNKICVVDVETTGTDSDIHEIIDICVLPLDLNFKPDRAPFQMQLRPNNMEAIDIEALKIRKHYLEVDKYTTKHKNVVSATQRGVDSMKAADYFFEWWKGFDFGIHKKIIPLAHNWPFDREFIKKWLSVDVFEQCFSPLYRDTMATTLYLNDKHGFVGEEGQYPYAKNNLQYLCSTLNIKRFGEHTALGDCVATAECYREILKKL